MHLVKKQEAAPMATIKVGGFAGWCIEMVHALWLGAKMRRGVKKQMSVIETLSIGGRKQLVLVSCAGEQFLVGTGADSVQTIVRVHTNPSQQEQTHVWGFGERL
jgi:flagellar biogenesis protein FliO